MRKLTFALSTAVLAFSGAAFAQPAQPRAPKPDMTRAEAHTRAEGMFARMDANRDGTIDAADRAARQAQTFDRLDTDRNGSLSRAEFEASRNQRGARAERMGGRKMERRMGQRRAMMDGAMSRQAFVDRALAMFDRADANRDGTVTQAERKTARDTMRQQWRSERPARQQG